MQNSALTFYECFTHCLFPHCHGQTFIFKWICPVILFSHSAGTDLVHRSLTSTKVSAPHNLPCKPAHVPSSPPLHIPSCLYCSRSSPGRGPSCSCALGLSEGMWDVLSAPCFPHSRCSQVPLPSPGAQRSWLLETASTIIPHGTKQLLGAPLRTLCECCDPFCSCFRSFYPFLSVQQVWGSQPSARALVGHSSARVQP